MAFCAKEPRWRTVLAGTGSIHDVSDALCAEAYACLVALDAERMHGISRVVLESDSMSLVSGLQIGALDRAASGVIFQSIRDIIDAFFFDFELCHVPRKCNGCAHMLAKDGLNRDPDHPMVWSDPLPEFVINYVCDDLLDQSNI